jgi:hypothetical protein
MPAKHRKPQSSSSSDDYDESDNEPPPKPAKKEAAPPKKIRIPVSQRNEVIQQKIRGIDHPDFSCVHNPSTQTWTVRRRKMPLDQSPKYRDDPIPPPVHQPAPAPTPTPPPPKEDVNLTWINMQSHVNDSLKKELGSLAEKYDKLASKYEEKKKAKKLPKKVVDDPIEDDYPHEYREPQRRPVPPKQPPTQQRYAPPPPQQRYAPPQPQPPKLKPGQYARGRALSIVDY